MALKVGDVFAKKKKDRNLIKFKVILEQNRSFVTSRV